jgi:hypothetical protein
MTWRQKQGIRKDSGRMKQVGLRVQWNTKSDMRRGIQYNHKDEEGRTKKWERNLIEETDYTLTPLVQR